MSNRKPFLKERSSERFIMSQPKFTQKNQFKKYSSEVTRPLDFWIQK